MHSVDRREPPWLVMVSKKKSDVATLCPAHEIACSFLYEHCVLIFVKKILIGFLPCVFFLLRSYTADLKRTIAVLLDDILTRLVKLEGKIESVANASSTNTSHTAGGVLASSHPGTSRLHPHIPNRPRPHQGA